MREFNVIGLEIKTVTKKNLSKQAMKQLSEMVGNCIHNGSRDAKLSSFAVDIYDGKKVVLSDAQLNEVKSLLLQDRSIAGFAYLAIDKYIDELLAKKEDKK